MCESMCDDEMAWKHEHDESMNTELKTGLIKVHSTLKCKTGWVKLHSASETKLWETKERQAWHDVWHDLWFMMFSWLDVPICICVWVEQSIYIVTAGMHRMIYVGFHTKRTYMHMCLNGTKNMYIVMARLHMMIYTWNYACIHIVTSHIAWKWRCAYMYKHILLDTTRFKVMMATNLSEHHS